MATPELTGRIDALRADVTAMIDNPASKLTPKQKTALKEIAQLLSEAADVVFGTRFRGGEPQRVHLFWHSVGNRVLTLMTNVLFNSTLSDMEVGYKAFRGDLLRSFRFTSDDFRIEPEMTAGVLMAPQIRVYEVPIGYYGRSFEEGKKITWRDGYRALGALVKLRMNPPRRVD